MIYMTVQSIFSIRIPVVYIRYWKCRLTLILYFFLRRLSATLVVAAAIPFSLIVTCGVMYLLDSQFDVLTMLGLMLGVGMLVDNAIVVTEGILIGVKSGQGVLSSARDVVGKTKWALLGGTIVGIIAFAPIGFALGVLARDRGRAAALSLCAVPLGLFYAADLLGLRLTQVTDQALFAFCPVLACVLFWFYPCGRILRR